MKKLSNRFANKPMTMIFILFSMAFVMFTPLSGIAQTRQAGPWWPNPEWGPEDQAGASNRITPEKVLSAIRLVRTGQIYELGQVYERGMPLYGYRNYSLLVTSLGAAGGTNRVVGNDDYVAAQLGQVGTQFDGLGHIGQELKLADGTVERIFYNGYTNTEMFAPGGLQKLGIENIKAIITRGILIDLASYKGVSRLERGYEVTVADVTGALQKQGMTEGSISAGDAVLFRYGWSELWDQPDQYNGSIPGIGVEVARWIAAHKITVVGGDNSSTEVSPNPDADLSIPVHQELMMKNGIFNIENMRFDELAADEVYEFLFIVTPLRLKGATGSPLRPIAIR